MAWQVIKRGTPTQVNAAINALNATDQSTAANAQVVRAKAILLAEVTAVGGSYVNVQAFGSMNGGNSYMEWVVQPVPFVDAAGTETVELTPNPNP